MAPKQWQLTKNETITSYESWRHSLIIILSLDTNFIPFLEATWQKQTAINPHIGLTDNGSSVPEAKRLTPVQKNRHLDLLLGQIASFCSPPPLLPAFVLFRVGQEYNSSALFKGRAFVTAWISFGKTVQT